MIRRRSRTFPLLMAAAGLTSACTSPVNGKPPEPSRHGILPSPPSAISLDYTADCSPNGNRAIQLRYAKHLAPEKRFWIEGIGGAVTPVQPTSIARLNRALASVDAVRGIHVMCLPDGGQILIYVLVGAAERPLSFSWHRGEIFQHSEQGRLIKE